MATLGLDLGTSAVKALVVDGAGDVVGRGSAASELAAPHEGWAEADPRSWWEGAAAATRQALATAGGEEVEAVGLAGQMHGVVLCDATGEPVRPALLWPDRRAAAALSAWERMPDAVRADLGNPLVPGMAGPLLAWVVGHEPGAVSAARWALQPKDWLRLRLCGAAASDPSDASATLLWSLADDAWAFDVARSVGIPVELLAPVQPSGAVAGGLTREAARALGLRAGTPVHVGAADTAAALVGAGLQPGDRLLNVGTGAQLVELRAAPNLDPRPAVHCYRTAGSGWYAMAAVQNAGLALDWVLATFGLSREQALAEAFGDPRLELDGALFVPHLSGERIPRLAPSARGAWTGLGLRHRREHLLRAAWHGVAHGIRAARDALTSPDAEPPRRWILMGGASLRPAYRQLLADALGASLELLDAADASAVGAAVLAGAPPVTGRVAGAVVPDPDATAHLDEEHARWRAQVDRLARAGPHG